MNKHAVIISCFDYHSFRMIYWENSLRDLGFQTTYLTSDFHHISKQTYTCSVENSKQLHVIPYQKNLSAKRILSHRMFAKQTYKFLQETQPDIIIASIPPNFLCSYLAKYKRKHPRSTVIFDIYDLWPETFPNSSARKLLAPVFHVWSSLRDRHLPLADYVVAECQLFLDRLNCHSKNSAVIPFALPAYEGVTAPVDLPTDHAQIAYLGSINNIIDIPKITAVLQEINKKMPTTLHIIGDGESREELCRSVAKTGVDIQFHGKVFDETEKHRILSQCHFGLNIMKDSVCVGLTMKSVDYLRHGLPLISNIPADTKNLIQQYRAGFHLSTPAEMADYVVSAIQQDMSEFKANADRLYREKVSSICTQPIYSRIIQKFHKR